MFLKRVKEQINHYFMEKNNMIFFSLNVNCISDIKVAVLC